MTTSDSISIAKQDSDWWKFTTTGLAGAVVAGLAFWLTAMTTYVTKDDVKDIVGVGPRWKDDKGTVFTTISYTQNEIRDLREDIKALVKSQSELNSNFKVFLERQKAKE